jgi:hypothetical protein
LGWDAATTDIAAETACVRSILFFRAIPILLQRSIVKGASCADD